MNRGKQHVRTTQEKLERKKPTEFVLSVQFENPFHFFFLAKPRKHREQLREALPFAAHYTTFRPQFPALDLEEKKKKEKDEVLKDKRVWNFSMKLHTLRVNEFHGWDTWALYLGGQAGIIGSVTTEMPLFSSSDVSIIMLSKVLSV